MLKPVSIRKKPVTIEAIRWTGDNLEAVQAFVGKARDCPSHERARDNNGFDVHHVDAGIEGAVWDYLHKTWVKVYVGQWVLRGLQGEFYPNADDNLRQTYDFVEPNTAMRGDGIERPLKRPKQ